MRGAVLFLMTFLLVVPNARAPFEAVWSELTRNIAMQYPFSYFLLVVMLSSSIVSSLIMWLWPHTKESAPKPQVLLRVEAFDRGERRRRGLRAFWQRLRLRAAGLLHRRQALDAKPPRPVYRRQAGADI
ncbi:MAG TPA: hypothetical protein VGF59_09090 [Bryobacteraceae bacterium]